MQTPSSLEVTIRSAEGLEVGRCWRDGNVFAAVNFGASNHAATETDSDGRWNQTLHLQFRTDVERMRIELKRPTLFGKDKVLGFAEIPVSDFRNDCAPPNYLHILSYSLRNLSGRRIGIIVNISVRVKQPIQIFGFAGIHK